MTWHRAHNMKDYVMQGWRQETAQTARNQLPPSAAAQLNGCAAIKSFCRRKKRSTGMPSSKMELWMRAGAEERSAARHWQHLWRYVKKDCRMQKQKPNNAQQTKATKDTQHNKKLRAKSKTQKKKTLEKVIAQAMSNTHYPKRAENAWKTGAKNAYTHLKLINHFSQSCCESNTKVN